jgi:hypothetical protein
MDFVNRQGTNLNRKRLRIISQSANEIIADVERADTPTVEGTPISASNLNQLKQDILNSIPTFTLQGTTLTITTGAVSNGN